MSEDRGLARRAAPLLIGVALLVAAIVPRLGPALSAYQPSNDAAEHLLIARSLARGEGFTLPIRVRDVDSGPAVHDAYGERAPLFPWLLSIPVRAGVGAEGWPDPRLQLVGVGLAALCAPLAASVAWALARRRGLGGWRAGWVAVGAGLVVAWMPSLVRASVHLWAEPLGLLLVLAAVSLDLRLEARGDVRVAAVLGVVGGLVRFARPEGWIVVPLLVARAVWRARRDSRRWNEFAALTLVIGGVNASMIAATGVVAPQLFLLEVQRYEEAMGAGAMPSTVDPGAALASIASNLAGQLEFMLLPKNGWFVLPLVCAWGVRLRGRGDGRAGEAWIVGWAAAFVLVTAGVWSTSDPYRFTIAPLALLAPVALVEAEARRQDRRLDRRVLAGAMASLVVIMGHAAGREMRGRAPEPPVVVAPAGGTPSLDDPWTYALVTGRPAILGRAR